MTTNATTTLLQSVRRQFEQFQQRHASSPGLVWLQTGANSSFADALESCLPTAGLFPNGRPTGTALLASRRDGDGQPIELILALPLDKTVNGAFASLAKEAGDCISDAASAAGVPESVLSENHPATRWLRVLFWFALEQPEFPGQTKWYLLNLIDGSAGRYAQIRDAVRCSIYVLDWLASQASTSPTECVPSSNADPLPSRDLVSIDPNDERYATVCGKRVYLGAEHTQVAKLFRLLAFPIGRACSMADVQKAVDGMVTAAEFRNSDDEVRKAFARVRKVLNKLNDRLRDSGADNHFVIHRSGHGHDSVFTMVPRHSPDS